MHEAPALAYYLSDRPMTFVTLSSRYLPPTIAMELEVFHAWVAVFRAECDPGKREMGIISEVRSQDVRNSE